MVLPANASTIIVGGQVGIKDDGSVSANLTEEVEEAFRHVEKALQAAGLGEDAWEYVFKVLIPWLLSKYPLFLDQCVGTVVGQRLTTALQVTTHEIPTPGLMDVVLATGRKFLKDTKPAWTGTGVPALFHPDLHLEIAVEAYLPENLVKKA